jgi:hypothetical protein
MMKVAFAFAAKEPHAVPTRPGWRAGPRLINAAAEARARGDHLKSAASSFYGIV